MKKGMEWERRSELLSILELLSSRSLGRGSIDRSIDRETEGSLNGGQPFRNHRCRRADRNFADSGSPCRNRSLGYKLNGVDDFLRLPARHTVTETRQFAISSPRGEAKMAGEKRGDVSNFGNFNRVTVFEIESFTKKLAIVRTID